MAINYNRFGDPAEASQLQTQSLKDIFARIGDERANRLEQQRGRESANSAAMRLLNTARLQGGGQGSGMSRALERGTEIGAESARDIGLAQNERDMMNRFRALSSAGQVAGQQQQMGLNEANYEDQLKRYLDQLMMRQEERGWSLQDSARSKQDQMDLLKYQQDLQALQQTPWYQKLAGGVARGVGAYFTGGLSEAGRAAARLATKK